MKVYISLLLLFFSGIFYAQIIPSTAKYLNDFVPKNWNVIKKVIADLNLDKKDDVVLIIKENNPNLNLRN